MPRVTVETPHALTQEEAMRRLKERARLLKDMFQGKFSDLHEEWNGNTFSFGFKTMGMTISGTGTVGASHVKLDTELPLAAMLFKGMIQTRVNEELGKLLA